MVRIKELKLMLEKYFRRGVSTDRIRKGWKSGRRKSCRINRREVIHRVKFICIDWKDLMRDGKIRVGIERSNIGCEYRV